MNDTPRTAKTVRPPVSFFTALAALLSCMLLACTALAEDKAPQVSLKTSMGEIVVELNPEKAPISVENFLKYVKKGHYKGTIFHRVIENFMIQGGGFESDKNQQTKPTDDPIKNEASNGLQNDPYTIAMARTNQPNSATAQFFINTHKNDFLNYPGQDGAGYCVFGKVVKGKEVVDKIKATPTTNKGGPFSDAPVTPVVIESATVVK